MKLGERLGFSGCSKRHLVGKVYANLHEFTRICASLRESARVYANLREFTRICASLRESARVYANLHEFTEKYSVVEDIKEDY